MMKLEIRPCITIVSMALVIAGLAGCSDTSDKSAPEGSDASAAATTSVADLPDRNIDNIDVCTVVPGNAVAMTLGLTLVGAEPGIQMCSYTLRSESATESGVQVVLTKSVSYLTTRNGSENASELPGLGVAAFARKATGSDQNVWVARKDGLIFHVLGFNGDVAERVAKLAAETIP